MRTDGQTGMTKLMFVFCNFANALQILVTNEFKVLTTFVLTLVFSRGTPQSLSARRYQTQSTAQFGHNCNRRHNERDVCNTRAGTAVIRHTGANTFQKMHQRLEVQRPRTIPTQPMKMP